VEKKSCCPKTVTEEAPVTSESRIAKAVPIIEDKAGWSELLRIKAEESVCSELKGENNVNATKVLGVDAGPEDMMGAFNTRLVPDLHWLTWLAVPERERAIRT
jgi:hypothetical protein